MLASVPWKNHLSNDVASFLSRPPCGLKVAAPSPCANEDGMCAAVREAPPSHSHVLAVLLLQIASLQGPKSKQCYFC